MGLDRELGLIDKSVNEESCGRLQQLEGTVSGLCGIMNPDFSHLDSVAQESKEIVVNGDGCGPAKEHQQKVYVDCPLNGCHLICQIRDNVTNILPSTWRLVTILVYAVCRKWVTTAVRV